MEARDAAKHPEVHRTARDREWSSPECNSPEAENPGEPEVLNGCALDKPRSRDRPWGVTLL